DVRKFIDDVFDGDIHAKRITSLAGATTGVLASGSLAISAIGLGLSHVCGTATKHAIKNEGMLKRSTMTCRPWNFRSMSFRHSIKNVGMLRLICAACTDFRSGNAPSQRLHPCRRAYKLDVA
ncbi:hypothetical protein MNBD_GAMMA24-2629, partial [hydrothermal vent metagenome]